MNDDMWEKAAQAPLEAVEAAEEDQVQGTEIIDVSSASKRLKEHHRLAEKFYSFALKVGSKEDNNSFRKRLDNVRRRVLTESSLLADFILRRANKKDPKMVKLTKDLQQVLARIAEAQEQLEAREKKEVIRLSSSKRGLSLAYGLSPAQEQDILAQTATTKTDFDILQERQESYQRLALESKELRSLFQDVNDLVIKQGEQLDELSENVDQAYVRVEEAGEYLTTADRLQSSAISKQKKIALLAAVIIAIIVIVVVLGTAT